MRSRLWTRASLPDVIFCEMDAGLIEYDTVTKKATRHRAKAKSAAGQNK